MNNTNFTNDREELKAAWRVLFFEEPPKEATWTRWYKSYGQFGPRMIREVLLRLAAKYQRERMTALQMENLANSILGRIDQERTAAIKKLKSELNTMPTFDQLGDSRDEPAGQEGRWNR